MNNSSMIRIMNLMLKCYEIVYIFVTPSPPLTRRYLLSENVDNSGRPLREVKLYNRSCSSRETDMNIQKKDIGWSGALIRKWVKFHNHCRAKKNHRTDIKVISDHYMKFNENLSPKPSLGQVGSHLN